MNQIKPASVPYEADRRIEVSLATESLWGLYKRKKKTQRLTERQANRVSTQCVMQLSERVKKKCHVAL